MNFANFINGVFVGMIIGATIAGVSIRVILNQEKSVADNNQKSITQIDSISTIPINENIPVWHGNKCRMWAVGDTVFLESGGWYVDQRGKWK